MTVDQRMFQCWKKAKIHLKTLASIVLAALIFQEIDFSHSLEDEIYFLFLCHLHHHPLSEFYLLLLADH